MSNTSEVNVVRVGPVTTHPNADKLELTMVGGYQMVIGKDQFKEGDLAVFIQPDSVVPGAKHLREGIVVRSLETGQRLKIVSNEYLTLK